MRLLRGRAAPATGEFGYLGVDHSAWGITQDRVGCLQCHEDGCGAGPAEGHCREWTFETRMLEPPTDAAQAKALHLANVSEPRARNASAWGALLPDQMRFFRVRPARGGLRLHVSLYAREGNLRLYARRGRAPGAVEGEYDLVTPHSAPRPRSGSSRRPSCCAWRPRRSRARRSCCAARRRRRRAACCAVGLRRAGHDLFPQPLRPGTEPRADLALFNLSARLEPEVVDFECAECGGDCSACGWSAQRDAAAARRRRRAWRGSPTGAASSARCSCASRR